MDFAANCRLCAEKPENLISIDYNYNKDFSIKVLTKLNRFNIRLDNDERLPRNVCNICIKSLDAAFTFVTIVEHAQFKFDEFLKQPANENIEVAMAIKEECTPPETELEINDYSIVDSLGIETTYKDQIQIEDAANFGDNNEPGIENDIEKDIRNITEHDYCIQSMCNKKYYIFKNLLKKEYVIIRRPTECDKQEIQQVKPTTKHKEIITTRIYTKPNRTEKVRLDYETLSNIDDIGDNQIDAASTCNKNNYTVKKHLKRKYVIISRPLRDKQEIQEVRPTTKHKENIATSNLFKPERADKVRLDYETSANIDDEGNNLMAADSETDTASETESVIIPTKIPSWKDVWKCLFCETSFETHKDLIDHSMVNHEACNPYQCFECTKYTVFKTLVSLVIHIGTHRKDLENRCFECNKICLSPQHLNKHYKEHFDPLKCIGCNNKFQTLKDLDDHKQKFYKNLERYKSLPKRCNVCKVTFQTPYTLKFHMSNKHPNLVDKKFVCEQCGDGFHYSDDLTKHVAKHKTEKFQCPHCNKQFNFKTCLNVHLLQHTGEKPYSCSVCDRRFTIGPNCNRHMLNVHGIDNRRRWQPAVDDDD